MELRPSRLDHRDALVLTELVQLHYEEIYGGRDDDPLNIEDFVPPRGGFVIGYVGGEAVAMGGWLWAADQGPGTAQLRRMFVAPEFRRRGLGGQLLTRLERDAAAAGARFMVLATGREQPDAIALYRARGYTDIAPFGFYAGVDGAVHLGRPLFGGTDRSRPVGR